jgi:hypothetical protein
MCQFENLVFYFIKNSIRIDSIRIDHAVYCNRPLFTFPRVGKETQCELWKRGMRSSETPRAGPGPGSPH